MKKNKRLLVFLLKIYVIFNICLVFYELYTCVCYAEELSFKEILNLADISEFNIKGERINEEIYFKYNTFVYSDPINLYGKTSIQRFKEVKDKGKMIYNQKQGEFYILGTNYNGEFVYNVYFPVDVVPESLPDSWEYMFFTSFEKSWEYNYEYIEQKEYMENTKLMFDRIDLEKNTSDSYDLIEYNVVPKIVGLGKFRLNTPATWKTMGIVTAKRRLKNGVIRDVIFKTNPMAINADIRSYINISNDLDMSENEDEKKIEIEFGAQAVNLSKYTKPEHVRYIESIIYINGEYVDKVSGSKMINVDKKINFIISREESLINGGNIEYRVDIKSFMCTNFKSDGVMYNHINKNFIIKVAPKKLVPIKSFDLKLLYINKTDILNNNENKDVLVVSPLVQTYTTVLDNSYGIIEKGRDLALMFYYGVPLNYIQNIDIYLNNEKIDYVYIKSLEDYSVLSINTISAKVTVASWFSLREKLGSYFEINSSDIGKRLDKPNLIKILVDLNVNNKEYEYIINFDAIDDYMKNINYRFKDYILNYDKLKEKVIL